MKRTLLFIVLAGCPLPDFVQPPGPPVIDRFEAAPFELAPGQTTTISWKVRGASAIELRGAGEPRPIEAEGALDLVLDRSAAFELIATGEGGTSRARAEVEVAELAEVQILRFEVTPSLVEPDDPVRVVWQTEHSTRVVVRLSSGETLIDQAPTAGTLVFRPERDVTVELSAEGWPEPKMALRTVRATPDGPSIIRFSAEPPIASIDEPVGLAWEVASADHVRVFELAGTSSTVLFDQVRPSNTGFLGLAPIAGTHTYLLEVANSVGVVVESATSIILPRTSPEIVSFSVTPTITGMGGDIVASWSARFADQVQLWIDSIPELAPISGTRIVRRVSAQDHFFELIAQEFTNLTEDSELRRVTFDPSFPEIIDLFALPSDVQPGGSTLITWRASQADSIALTTDWGEVLLESTDAEGDFLLSPVEDVSLIFTATNDRGVTTAFLPIRVIGQPVIVDFSADTTIARTARPVTFRWTTERADRGTFAFQTIADVRPVDSSRQYTSSLGEQRATLEVSNEAYTVTATLGISVIEPALGPVELEPNDTEPFAAGPYFTFPGSVTGEVAEDDVDLYELVPTQPNRIRFDTTPDGGCTGGVAIEVYELNRELGLLGPRLVVDVPDTCASADAEDFPILATLKSNLFVAVRRPAGASTSTSSRYRLSYVSQDGFCSDNVVDLDEECDDTNVMSGDGCSHDCKVEGLDEMEPNDLSAVAIALDAPVRAYLAFDDVDRFRFQILDSADEGQHSIQLEAPAAGDCNLDAELILTNASTGDFIASDDNGGLGCPQLSGPAMILTQGVYELEVRPGLGISLPTKGRYVFSVR